MMKSAPPGFPGYDMRLAKLDWLGAEIYAWFGRLTFSNRRYWRKLAQEPENFLSHLKRQVYLLCPKLFAFVDIQADSNTDEYLKQGGAAIYAALHHGFFTLIPFVIRSKYHIPVAAIATAPARNLKPEINPDHKIWKYLFYYQAKRFLGRRCIFSDESPRITINWLKAGYGAIILIDVDEYGYRRKCRSVYYKGQEFNFPDSVIRLARITKVPLIAASCYLKQERPMLQLGPLQFVTKENETLVFNELCNRLFDPVMRHPEQCFFDIFTTFKK